MKTDIINTEILVDTVQKLSLARDINAVMGIVRTVARNLIGADGATFVLKDKGYCYYADEDAISPLWKGNRFPMEICISGWVMMNRKPVVIQDIYEDERIPAEAYRPTFVKSLAMVPIRTMNPIGAIGNYWATHRFPSEQEISLLQALADITAVSIENIEVRNKLKEKLAERTNMVNQLERQKKQLEEFTQIIAHNMRAPLSNLLLLNDMIETSQSVNEKLMFLEKQKSIIDSLHETFEDLVSANQVRIDFSIDRDFIELKDSVITVINLLESEIAKSEAQIAYDLSKVKIVHFPKSYLENIIFNLLSNAIKYRSPERTPEIKITSYKQGRWNYLKIEDNGLGIDLKKHGNNIFKLHKTFHNNPTAKGFGLYFSKTQIEAMGGRISVRSMPGKGSSFILKLNKN
jgi:signal transduction histidine kinase